HVSLLSAAATALILLFLSLSVFHSRLSTNSSSSTLLLRLDLPSVLPRRAPSDGSPVVVSDDSDNVAIDESAAVDDRIDELDVLEEEDDVGRSLEEDNADQQDPDEPELTRIPTSGLFLDRGRPAAQGVLR
ncbi:hypothetical protein BHM03_00060013, partial [Ensete ventricosum]